MSRHHADTDLDPTVAAELDALEAALAGDPAAPPELTALVTAVREDAPGPSLACREGLDARVAAGFGPRTWPAAVRARLPRVPFGLSPALGLAAVVVIALVVSVGVLRQGGSTTDRKASGTATPSAAGRRADDQALRNSSGTLTPVPGSSSPAPTPQSGRKVQRSTRLSLTTSAGRLQDVADDVVQVTQSAGGVVQTSNVDATDRDGSATFELSVPTADADDTVKRLSALAHVASLSQASTDITASYVSATDALSDARAELRTSLKALKGAKTDAGIARLRKRIRDRRREIATLESQVKRVRARADNTSLSVSLSGRGASKGDGGSAGGGPWNPGDAAGDALRVLEVALGVLLIALAVALPLALILLPALLAARVTRRRRREHALDPA